MDGKTDGIAIPQSQKSMKAVEVSSFFGFCSILWCIIIIIDGHPLPSVFIRPKRKTHHYLVIQFFAKQYCYVSRCGIGISLRILYLLIWTLTSDLYRLWDCYQCDGQTYCNEDWSIEWMQFFFFCFRGRTAFCPDLQSGISANAPTHRVHITDDDDDTTTTTTTTAALDTDICFPVEML